MSLTKHTVTDLRQIADDLEIDTTGLRKPELIAAIQTASRISRERSETPRRRAATNSMSTDMTDLDFEFDPEDDEEVTSVSSDGDEEPYIIVRAPVHRPSKVICQALLIVEALFLTFAPGPAWSAAEATGRQPLYSGGQLVVKAFSKDFYASAFLWIVSVVLPIIFAVVYVWVWDKHSKHFSVFPFAVMRFSLWYLFQDSATFGFATLFQYIPERLFHLTWIVSGALAAFDRLV